MGLLPPDILNFGATAHAGPIWAKLVESQGTAPIRKLSRASPSDTYVAVHAPLARLDAAIAPHQEVLATPALVIDLDAVEHNIAALVRRCGESRCWRPHVKTVKQAVILRQLFTQGVLSCKCATLDELELVLTTADAAAVQVDVLIAYPLHKGAFRVAIGLAQAHPTARVSFLADSPAHARDMQSWLDDDSSRWPLFFDVDVGMHRTGTFAARWRVHAAALANELTGFEIAGLHGYDGHLRADQQAEANAAYDELCALALAIIAAGVPISELITSGSNTYAIALGHSGLGDGAWQHSICPGTIVLNDLRCTAATADLDLWQAAFVATRVISRDGVRRITVDAGSKALSPDRPPPNCRVLGWPELMPKHASEEHLPMDVGGLATPALGQLLWLVPDHVCTTVNLYNLALLVSGQEVVGESPIASGRCLWLAPPPHNSAG